MPPRRRRLRCVAAKDDASAQPGPDGAHSAADILVRTPNILVINECELQRCCRRLEGQPDGRAYIFMAYIVMAHIVMTYILMAHVNTANIVMAYVCMAY